MTISWKSILAYIRVLCFYTDSSMLPVSKNALISLSASTQSCLNSKAKIKSTLKGPSLPETKSIDYILLIFSTFCLSAVLQPSGLEYLLSL